MVAYRTAISVIAGVFLGRYISLEMAKQLPETVYTTITQGDLATMAIGVLLMIFGGRVHALLKWMGIGILAYQAAEEISELVGKPVVTASPPRIATPAQIRQVVGI